MQRLTPFFPALFVLLWSTGFIGARYAMPHAEPFTFLALRFALALALLLALIAGAKANWPPRGTAFHAAFAGALIHGLYLGGVFYAVRHGLSAGIVALIVGLQPVLTSLLAARMLGERIGARQWLGLGLGLLGVALVIVPKIGADAQMRAETLVPAFLAVAAITLGTVWQKRFVRGVALRTGTALQYLGALAPTALFAFGTETMVVDWTGELVFALLWLVLVLSIGAVFLMLRLIETGAVSSLASLMYLVPGVTAVMAFALFGETLTPLQLLGLAVSGIGVAAATRKPRAKAATVL